MSVSSRRQRERAERRASITRAAARVFRKKGLAAATMDDIASEAELSKGTLYLYFSSKDELFLAMAAGKIEQVVSRFDEILARSRGRFGLELLTDMIGAYAQVATGAPDLFRTALFWIASPEPVDTDSDAFAHLRRLIGRVIGGLVRAIEKGREDGSVRGDIEPRRLAVQVWSGAIGTLLVHLNGEELSRRFPLAVDFDDLIAGFVELIGEGLRPREDAP